MCVVALFILVNSLEQLKYTYMIWLNILRLFKMHYYIVIVVIEKYLRTLNVLTIFKR